MTCNVVWLRQALAEYQNRLNNVLLVTAALAACISTK